MTHTNLLDYNCLLHSNAFFDSFSADAIWKQDPPPTGDDAVMYFFNDIIGMSTVWNSPDLRPTRLVGKNVGYSFLGWLIIYVSVRLLLDYSYM